MAYVFEDAAADIGRVGKFLRERKDAPNDILEECLDVERWFDNKWRQIVRGK